ncbi:hypothetical protein ABK040_014297 [Willaertia magna]
MISDPEFLIEFLDEKNLHNNPYYKRDAKTTSEFMLFRYASISSKGNSDITSTFIMIILGEPFFKEHLTLNCFVNGDETSTIDLTQQIEMINNEQPNSKSTNYHIYGIFSDDLKVRTNCKKITKVTFIIKDEKEGTKECRSFDINVRTFPRGTSYNEMRENKENILNMIPVLKHNKEEAINVKLNISDNSGKENVNLREYIRFILLSEDTEIVVSKWKENKNKLIKLGLDKSKLSSCNGNNNNNMEGVSKTSNSPITSLQQYRIKLDFYKKITQFILNDTDDFNSFDIKIKQKTKANNLKYYFIDETNDNVYIEDDEGLQLFLKSNNYELKIFAVVVETEVPLFENYFTELISTATFEEEIEELDQITRKNKRGEDDNFYVKKTKLSTTITTEMDIFNHITDIATISPTCIIYPSKHTFSVNIKLKDHYHLIDQVFNPKQLGFELTGIGNHEFKVIFNEERRIIYIGIVEGTDLLISAVLPLLQHQESTVSFIYYLFSVPFSFLPDKNVGQIVSQMNVNYNYRDNFYEQKGAVFYDNTDNFSNFSEENFKGDYNLNYNLFEQFTNEFNKLSEKSLQNLFNLSLNYKDKRDICGFNLLEHAACRGEKSLSTLLIEQCGYDPSEKDNFQRNTYYWVNYYNCPNGINEEFLKSCHQKYIESVKQEEVAQVVEEIENSVKQLTIKEEEDNESYFGSEDDRSSVCYSDEDDDTLSISSLSSVQTFLEIQKTWKDCTLEEFKENIINNNKLSSKYVEKYNLKGTNLLFQSSQISLDFVKYVIEELKFKTETMEMTEALGCACNYGKLDIVKYLIEKGASVTTTIRIEYLEKTKRKLYRLPEYYAEIHIQYLLKRNTSTIIPPNIQKILGNCNECIKIVRMKRMKEMINGKLEDGKFLKYISLSEIKELIKQKGNHHYITESDERSNRTLLHHSVINNRVDLVKYLIQECGMDYKEVMTEQNYNCLHYACFYGSFKTLIYLLSIISNKNDLEILNKKQETSLQAAKAGYNTGVKRNNKLRQKMCLKCEEVLKKVMEHKKEEYKIPLDFLNGMDLSGIDLSHGVLTNLDLSNTNLSCCHLQFTDMSNVNLSNSNLYYSNLSNINLSNSLLFKTNLTKTNLENSILKGANLNTNKQIGIDLRNCQIDDNTQMTDELWNSCLNQNPFNKAMGEVRKRKSTLNFRK